MTQMIARPWSPVQVLVLVLVGALISALVLAFAVPAIVQAQSNGTIEYPENGMDPVATLTADDPEGDTVTWSIVSGSGGTDETSFTVGPNDGVLKFNTPPDYEGGATTGGGDANNDNTYQVIVTATDSASPPNTETYTLNVKVTNLEETGKVAWTVDPDGGGSATANALPAKPAVRQFQVGAILMVPATDGVTDGDVQGSTKDVTERLQWSRASSKTGPWTPIRNATGITYTLTTDDIGMYIRVDAFYNVGTGREESAYLASDYPVLSSRTGNAAPKFPTGTIKRSVDEGDKGAEVGAPVTATDDIANELKYALADATTADNAKFNIDPKTGQITTKFDLDREATTEASATAAGSCETSVNALATSCQITITATDSAGLASSATVTIAIGNVDEKPTFTSGYKVVEVAENTTDVDANADTDSDPATGASVYTAEDPEDLRITLSLTGADAAKFNLINVGNQSGYLSFKAKPDYEKPTDANRDNVYEVTVRASDGTLTADRMVRVAVTGEDDAPTVTGPSSVDYAESRKNPVATFTADDPEDETVYWGLDGADAAQFGIDKGVLEFSPAPDFENPADVSSPADNIYEVTVLACDVTPCNTSTVAARKTEKAVMVKVTNVPETGKVTWTVDADGSGGPDTPTLLQFQVGATLVASVSDGDSNSANAIGNWSWRWYRGGTHITTADSTGATSTYTVSSEALNSRIRVEVGYTVGDGREERASLTADYPVLGTRTSNNAPTFPAGTIKRSVDEGDKGRNVGVPVTATDDTSNALTYALVGTGPDDAKFDINAKTGQITTKFDLNREATTEASATAAGSCETSTNPPATACQVTITATDSAGLTSAAKTVDIAIGNVDEKPAFTSGYKMVEVSENTTDIDADVDGDATITTGDSVYAATDPEGLHANLSLMGGADAAKFNFHQNGYLSFKVKPDFENPGDANRDNVYEVTVRASAGGLTADRMVRVAVTNVNEAPTIIAGGLAISGDRSPSVAEGETEVASYTVAGQNADNATWSLSGDDAGDFRISSSGALIFRTAPDYEAPADANGDNNYSVTLTATAGADSDTQDVTVTVTNEDEDGTLTVPSAARQGMPITATVTDPDGGVTNVSWQWAIDDGSGNFEDITGANTGTYTPEAGDQGKALQVTVTYDDALGTGKMLSETTNAVTASDPLLAEYDPNGDGTIEMEDMRRAVANFFGASPTVSDEDMRRLVRIYFT